MKLFEFSLNSFCAYGMKLKNISLDLHNSDFEGNVMTEYEKLFSENGVCLKIILSEDFLWIHVLL